MPVYRIKFVPKGIVPKDVELGVHLTPSVVATTGSEGDCQLRFTGIIITPVIDTPNPGDITYHFTWAAGTEFCKKCVEVVLLASTLPPDVATDLSFVANCTVAATQSVDVIVPAAALANNDWSWTVMFEIETLNFGEYTKAYCLSQNYSNTIGVGEPFTAGFGPGLWPTEFTVDGLVCGTGCAFNTGMEFDVRLNGVPITPALVSFSGMGTPTQYLWVMNFDVSGTSPGDTISVQPILCSDSSDFGSPMIFTGV